jgi:hypothetical protein
MRKANRDTLRRVRAIASAVVVSAFAIAGATPQTGAIGRRSVAREPFPLDRGQWGPREPCAVALGALAINPPSATAHGFDGPHRRRFTEDRSRQIVCLLTNGKQEI